MSENREKDAKKQVQIQIQLDEEVAQGMYVNLALVNHNENEFTIDVMYLQPQQPRAKVRARPGKTACSTASTARAVSAPSVSATA